MSKNYLHREDAPFGDEVWKRIDECVVGAAKSQLCGRRLLHIEGPYGLGLKSLPTADEIVAEKSAVHGVDLFSGSPVPVLGIQGRFTLGARDIASFEQTGLPFDTAPVAEAAIAWARREDALIFNGSKALGVEGLLNAKGTQSADLKSWDEVGAAIEEIIASATKLDDAGFHGPYALALTPSRYNLLFRRYLQGNLTELEHLRLVATDGVIKAPGIPSGGLLLATGRQYAAIVLGQDLVAAFVGPSVGGYEFTISESLALRLLSPQAVCVLK